jgi:hypothetical protein
MTGLKMLSLFPTADRAEEAVRRKRTPRRPEHLRGSVFVGDLTHDHLSFRRPVIWSVNRFSRLPGCRT